MSKVEVPEFVVVNQGLVYSRSSRKLARRDLLSEADQELVGCAPIEWLENNRSIPGWKEAMASSLESEQLKSSAAQSKQDESKLQDQEDDYKLRLSEDWD
jgi:hypothetical protein